MSDNLVADMPNIPGYKNEFIIAKEGSHMGVNYTNNTTMKGQTLTPSPEKVGNVPEGLYNLSTYEDTLKDIIGGEASNLNIKPLKHNGRLEVKIKRPFAILKRDNTASSVLGFNTESRRQQIT